MLEDPSVSPAHCELRLDPGGNCTLTDMNSQYGTYVSNQRIRAVVLVHGSMIRIGNTEIRYLAE
jgi:pSer/pThr/pTyr-binding forkhead associated (FHA) protein